VHPGAVPHEDVQVGAHGQSVGKTVSLLKRTVLCPEPDVPFVVCDVRRALDLLQVRGALDERASATDCSLSLVGLRTFVQ
jgi:hypothetical protein